MSDQLTLYRLTSGVGRNPFEVFRIQSLIDDGWLVPVEPCTSFSPESHSHCHLPRNHDGAHEAYRSYGHGVFHTASWSEVVTDDE